MREGRTQTEGGHKNGEQNDGNELENDPGFSHVFDLQRFDGECHGIRGGASGQHIGELRAHRGGDHEEKRVHINGRCELGNERQEHRCRSRIGCELGHNAYDNCKCWRDRPVGC